jgi:hypothetical protein
LESERGFERVFTGLCWFLVRGKWRKHEGRRYAVGSDDDIVFVSNCAAGSGGLERGDFQNDLRQDI